LGGKKQEGVFDFLKAGRCHSEKANLVGGAETVFDGPQDAIMVVLIAFKVDDGVDHVFKQFGPGDVAFFSDVADDNDGNKCGFGDLHKDMGDLLDLGRRAGLRG